MTYKPTLKTVLLVVVGVVLLTLANVVFKDHTTLFGFLASIPGMALIFYGAIVAPFSTKV